MSSSSSVAYHLLGQSSTDPDIEPDPPQASLDPIVIKMGKQLGTFRAVYLVAICSIGSFLFAYVRSPMATRSLLTSTGYWDCRRCFDVGIVST